MRARPAADSARQAARGLPLPSPPSGAAGQLCLAGRDSARGGCYTAIAARPLAVGQWARGRGGAPASGMASYVCYPCGSLPRDSPVRSVAASPVEALAAAIGVDGAVHIVDDEVSRPAHAPAPAVPLGVRAAAVLLGGEGAASVACARLLGRQRRLHPFFGGSSVAKPLRPRSRRSPSCVAARGSPAGRDGVARCPRCRVGPRRGASRSTAPSTLARARSRQCFAGILASRRSLSAGTTVSAPCTPGAPVAVSVAGAAPTADGAAAAATESPSTFRSGSLSPGTTRPARAWVFAGSVASRQWCLAS